jgi:hypothetical protein
VRRASVKEIKNHSMIPCVRGATRINRARKAPSLTFVVRNRTRFVIKSSHASGSVLKTLKCFALPDLFSLLSNCKNIL